MCQALSAQCVASMQSLVHAAGISEERQSLTSCLTLCDPIKKQNISTPRSHFKPSFNSYLPIFPKCNNYLALTEVSLFLKAYKMVNLTI